MVQKCRKHQKFNYLLLWVQYNLLCEDFNNNHNYLRELRGDIACWVILKFGEKHWIYEHKSIYYHEWSTPSNKTVFINVIPTQVYCMETHKHHNYHYKCDVQTPPKEYNESTICWHLIKLYLLFILHKVMMTYWINPIHMAKAYE